ncbi:molybdate ABC transporter substrate-binding protein [Campylobacterota bacterium DY0563]
MFNRILILTLISTLFLNADDLKIAAGAGYKKVVLKVIKEYEKDGKNIDGFFGNMRQVSTQVKQTDIALIIGDKNFLLNKSGLDIKEYSSVGEGKVVIAYPKGKTLTSSKDLLKKEIKKIAMPQPKKAIYGIAGLEFLKNEELYKNVEDKLYVVATVPQSLTYVLTKEVDASIINLTAALENKDKIGGYIEVDPNSYSPIEIIAAKTSSCKKECEEFLEFLQTPKAKEIFKAYGL